MVSPGFGGLCCADFPRGEMETRLEENVTSVVNKDKGDKDERVHTVKGVKTYIVGE